MQKFCTSSLPVVWVSKLETYFVQRTLNDTRTQDCHSEVARMTWSNTEKDNASHCGVAWFMVTEYLEAKIFGTFH